MAMTPPGAAAVAAGSILPGGRYRSKWYSVGDDHGAFCAIGIHGQWIYVDPATTVVIAKLSSQPLPVDEAMEEPSSRLRRHRPRAGLVDRSTDARRGNRGT